VAALNSNQSASNHGAAGSVITPQLVGEAVFRAIDLLNDTVAETQRITNSADTTLVDTGGSLDSMAMVNLLIFVEDDVSANFGRELDLTGNEPLDPQDLKTVGSLIDALFRRLSEPGS
jgi:acyl carrier protein